MVTNVEKQRQMHNALNIPAENTVFQVNAIKSQERTNNQRSQSENTVLQVSNNNQRFQPQSQGQDTPLEGGDIMEDNQHWQAVIAGMVQKEMGKAHIEQSDNYQEANLTGQRDFSYSALIHYSCSMASLNRSDSWIIDNEASTHICGNLDLFESYKPTNSIHTVNLPDNTVKPIQAIATVFIHKGYKTV
ncbi:hypothetical protein LIER_41001 [Lithospermum erythrorhizon]|uniref:Retrovirus-related Pol polyprotein from transposon TNT 1-94-like beta-barrel domain-containing protein n=1 Tax=Lithospermum erythrorhizon TaxID=34254 RepID=A0AAV3R2X0_LITER